MNISDNLLEYVKNRVVIDPKSECWIWTKAGKDRPIFTRDKKQHLVYRELWCFLHKTTLTRDQLICHTCDNGMCCNPGHLFLGSHQENMDDMASKKRSFGASQPELHKIAVTKGLQVRRENPGIEASGLRHGTKTKPESLKRGDEHWTKKHPEYVHHGSKVHNARFTDEQVGAIRADCRTLKAVAADYSCHFSTIWNIRNNKHYA